MEKSFKHTLTADGQRFLVAEWPLERKEGQTERWFRLFHITAVREGAAPIQSVTHEITISRGEILELAKIITERNL